MRRRAGGESQSTVISKSLIEIVDLTQLQQQSTDYRSLPLVETLPLKERAKRLASKWPEPNRTITPKVLPAKRMKGTIWRRYVNGSLDLNWAYGKLSEAVNVYALGIPMDEISALAISAVFPDDFSVPNIPKSVVEEKAYLDDAERARLQHMCSRRLLEDLFGKCNNDS